MSYFGLGEFNFNKNINLQDSPLGALYKSNFDLTTLRYPGDLGSIDKAHYIVFYAKRQRNSRTSTPGMISYASSNPIVNSVAAPVVQYANETIGNAISSVQNMATSAVNTVTGVFDNITNNVKDIFGSLTGNSKLAQNIIDSSIKQVTGSSFNFLRTSQTSDAIALYMPDTMMYNHTQHFDRLELGSEVAGRVMAATKSMADAHRAAGGGQAGKDAAAAAAAKSAVLEGSQIGSNILGNIPVVGSPSTSRLLTGAFLGVVSNPLLEMIYKSPDFRSFQFEFMFYPRDQREALEVQKIIQRFYYHHAPEIVQEAQGFLVPPSEFDIKMYYNGQVNPNIPTIATCVLENIMVDYAPLGFTTYEVPGASIPSLGGTGMPVAIRLILNFRETTYLTKDDFTSSDVIDYQ